MTTPASELLLEQFYHLVITPDAVEQLDRALLQLAVQGKLVSQDAKDEPASELLKRIRAEQDPKGFWKPLGSMRDEDKLFELPQGWEWATLPEIGKVNPRNAENDNLKEASFIPMAYIPEEYGGTFKFDVRPWGEIRRNFTHLQDNDVAVAKITPCFENGKAIVFRNLVNGIGAGTTELHVFRGNPDWIVPEYVLLFFKNAKFVEDGKRRMTGSAGQQRVPKEHVTQTPFPLPPTAEQHRIVARVEQLFAQTRALREKLSHAQTELTRLNQAALARLLAAATPQEFAERWSFLAENFDTLYSEPEHIAPLRQAILELAVRGKLTRRESADEPASELLERIRQEKIKLVREGKIKESDALPPIKEEEKPFELAEGWEWVRLGEIAEKLGAGSTPKGGKQVYEDSGIKFIRSQNVWNDGLRLDDVAFITEQVNNKMAGSVVKPKDILLNITGASIARSALVPDDFDSANVNQHVTIIRLVDLDLREYIHYCLISPYIYNLIMSVEVGASREGLSMMRLREFVLPIPPIAEQHRIVARVEQLMKLCDALETKLTAAQEGRERLTAALLANIG